MSFSFWPFQSLIIGVSNDAVNFLNSAIGSKAATFRVIIAIAGAGVLVGAVFSNGMMEVARKGIFHPEYFAFSHVMVIFLGVMLTNILLPDIFNTIGLPTSTTVSIVFGLLGAAVAVSPYKISGADNSIANLDNYINIESSVMIVVGIFLSVIIAFNAGLVIQWFVRLAFSFNVRQTSKYWTGLWGGFAITSILYFLPIKGAKGSTLVRTHAFHRKRAEKREKLESEILRPSHEVLKSCDNEVQDSIFRVSRMLSLTYTNLFKENHKELKSLKKQCKHLSKEINKIRQDIPDTLKKFKESELECGHHYAHVVAYMKEMNNSLAHIILPAFNHLDNNHPLDKGQTDTMKDFNNRVHDFFSFVINLLKKRKFEEVDQLISKRDELIDLANDLFRSRIKILKKTHKGVKVTVTYMEMLVETKNLLLNVVQLVKSDFSLINSFTSAEEMTRQQVLD